MALTLNAGSGGSDLKTAVVASEHIQHITLDSPLGDSLVNDTLDTLNVSSANAANFNVTETNSGDMLTSLQLLDNAISGAGFNITQLGGAAVPIGAGVEATALRVTLATDSTGVVSIDDNGGSLTVDGTVTANLSATDNAVLDQIDNNTDFGAVVGGGLEATALRVTIASDSTGVLSIDDGGGSITIDGTVTANLSATDNAVLDSIDAAVNGTLTVGSHAVTNAGTFATQLDGAALTSLQLIDNSIFADDAAFTLASSSVTMAGAIRDDSLTTLTAIEGDAVPLRVSSTGALHVTGAGGGTQYNVDDAAGGTDTGTLSLAVRDDSLTTLTPVDGDYVPLRVNSTGALHVTGAGGGTQYSVDDASGGTDTGTALLVVRDDSLTTLTPVDGDYTTLRVNSTGALHVTGGGGGTEYNEDDATPGTITGTATLMERDDALSTLTPIEGDWVSFRGTAEGALWVQDFNSDSALTSLQTIDNIVVVEDASHNTGDSGVMGLAVRNDNLAALSDTDGDYSPFQVSAEGALYSTLAGVQSSGNTSTTPLGSSATFTGTGEQNEYPDVMVSLTTDNTGTLYFDFSPDGTNWSTFPVNGFAVASGVHEFHTALKGPRYFRARLVNDAGAQSYLRLYTYYGNFSKIPNAPLNQTIGDDSDAINTHSIIIGEDSGGTYRNVGTTTGGNLQVSISELSDGVDIGAGNAGSETQRVSISTDDVNLSGMLTSLQLIDNAVYVDDAAYTLGTDSGVMVMGFAGAQTVNSGDAAALACNTSGALHVNLNSQTADVTIADGGNSITVDNAGTFATQATLQANSGVDIGDVDVTSLIPGTGGTALGKAQDTAVGATDTGVAMLVQRDDEQAAVTPADGDYVVPRCDRFGNIKTTQLPDATSAVQYGVINVASSGDNTLQAAAGAGIRIRVLSMWYTCGGTVNVRIESGAGGTALTGIQEWTAQTGMVLPFNPAGWFQTADNALLNMELSAAVNVDGGFTYVEV